MIGDGNQYPAKQLTAIAQAVARDDEVGVRVAVIELAAEYLLDIRLTRTYLSQLLVLAQKVPPSE